MYKAEISFVSEDIGKAERLFIQEMGKRDRSSIELKKRKKSIVFCIKAKDAVALRSTLHGITKLLEVYDKNGR